MTWAQRLKRVFKIDIETCEQCGGTVKVIASIEDPVVIKQIRVFVDLARDLLARRQTKLVKAQVRYESRDGRCLCESFAHDLRIWRDFGEVLLDGGRKSDDPTQ